MSWFIFPPLHWQGYVVYFLVIYAIVSLALGLYRRVMGRAGGSYTKATALVLVENGEESIEGAVRHLMGLQEVFYPHWEILVIDNFSQDTTLQILAKLQRECPNLRIIRPRSFAAPSLLEWGINQCEGDLVILYDLMKGDISCKGVV